MPESVPQPATDTARSVLAIGKNFIGRLQPPRHCAFRHLAVLRAHVACDQAQRGRQHRRIVGEAEERHHVGHHVERQHEIGERAEAARPSPAAVCRDRTRSSTRRAGPRRTGAARRIASPWARSRAARFLRRARWRSGGRCRSRAVGRFMDKNQDGTGKGRVTRQWFPRHGRACGARCSALSPCGRELSDLDKEDRERG